MHVAVLRLELKLGDCSAPRHKRRRMRQVFTKLRRHFNVALAEVDPRDGPDRATLGLSAVGASRREAREPLERAAEAVAAHPRIEITGLAFHEL